jgi:hypothetical protein
MSVSPEVLETNGTPFQFHVRSQSAMVAHFKLEKSGAEQAHTMKDHGSAPHHHQAFEHKS